MKVCGIDPGLDGAYAIDGQAYKLYTLPGDPTDAVEDMVAQGVTRALLEEPLSTYTLTGNRAVTSLVNFGRLKQCLLDKGISVEMVHPATWKKAMGITNSKLSDKQKKEASIAKAKELFPQANLKKTDKSTKDHDGFAEALLILEYGKRRGIL